MSVHDPREEISHDVEIGQVYRDARTDERMVLIYLDRSVYILRDSEENHRMGSRRELDENIGSDRYKLVPDADTWGETGLLNRVIARADEYEESGGRKCEHFATGMREAIDILQDTSSKDAHETVAFEEIDGVGDKTASRLRSTGYKTRQDVRRASDSGLLEVSGVGSSNLENIRDAVK